MTRPGANSSRYLLDTHVFLWMMLANIELRQRRALEMAALTGNLFVSPMSCWEIGMLAARGRINFGIPCHDWTEQALKAPGITLLSLSARIAVEASYLPGKIHGDPVDRMLIASARLNNLTLATRDKNILAYSKNGYLNVLPC